ncbi:uncharacterized protein LOC106875555 [Octopus bimaculoides]|uniref:Uncharacterized protein n=1 Tax=Octopus bimaculoides TaxID=37653 RepID=A0A0L8GPT6_OCTBM|nr:uncharacterized protein LOC106875555 [Octopus bimaculoides]|eukprot:XP_014779244.1 PREDICTED: uncharacterized protein LOC106875555 [Octopus bimaculoides]
MTLYISLVLILCVCGSQAGDSQPLLPCFSGTDIQPFSSYCPDGYKFIMKCSFAKIYTVNLCYKLPPTTTSKPLPTTTSKPLPSTQSSTLLSTLSTLQSTLPTTTPTTEPTTTQPTTTQPTTTQPTTTQPTTTVPTTTPQPRGCGRYPVQAFMMGASSATQCQPWLGIAAFQNYYMNNAILIGEDTVLSIQPFFRKGITLDYHFGEKYNTKITGAGLEVDQEHKEVVNGTNFILTKLKENVTVSGCVNPICIPEKRSDYSMENCFAATYVKDSNKIMHVEIGETRLINGSCTSSVQPPYTLCAYNFVQICNKHKENSGALICQSKKDKSWMLAGMTRETSDVSGCIPNAWNEPVYYWDTVEIMKEMNISSNA